jgi:hypothetical protein
MAHTVFICHSSKDKLVADAACAALEAQRIACWIAPRDVLGGTEYMEELDLALQDCQIVLLIFSQMANDSPQVRREIERAVSYEKIILPFRIEDTLPTRAMKFALSNTHWLDAMTPPMERRLADLCNTTSRLIRKAADNPPAGARAIPELLSNEAGGRRTEASPSENAVEPLTRTLWWKTSSTLQYALVSVSVLAFAAVFVAGRFFVATPSAPAGAKTPVPDTARADYPSIHNQIIAPQPGASVAPMGVAAAAAPDAAARKAKAALTPPAAALTPPATGSLLVQTNPNALVSIDGKIQGKADGSGRFTVAFLTAGVHTVEITLENYQPVTVAVSIADQQILTLNQLMLQAPPAIATSNLAITAEDRQGIREAVSSFEAAYQAAYKTKNLSQIPAAWLNRGQLERVFEFADIANISENCPANPAISGNTATWQCTETTQVYKDVRATPPSVAKVTLTFAKTNGQWRLIGKN